MGAICSAASPAAGSGPGSGCDLVVVLASTATEPAWGRAVEDLRATLAHELAAPECVPLRLTLEASPEGLRVLAQSPDGRETTRTVRDPVALVPVVLGLLAAVPLETQPSRPASPQKGRAAPSAPVAPDPHELPDFSVPQTPRNTAPSPVGVALGLSTGVRVGVPTDVAMLDTELRADVLLHDWSVLALMRYAPIAAVSGLPSDPDVYEEIAVGFGLGRELRWGRNTLDLTGSPSVVFVTLETDGAKEKEGELAQFRINLAARYGYRLGAGWRFTLTLDSEAAPSSFII